MGHTTIHPRQFIIHSAECFLRDPDSLKRTQNFELCFLVCRSQNTSLFRLSQFKSNVWHKCSVKGSLCSGQTDQLCHKHRYYHTITHANQSSLTVEETNSLNSDMHWMLQNLTNLWREKQPGYQTHQRNYFAPNGHNPCNIQNNSLIKYRFHQYNA